MLSAFSFGPGIPRDRQRLQVAAAPVSRKYCWSGMTPKVKCTWKVLRGTIGTVGAHHEFVVALEQARRDVAVVRSRIIEVAEHGFVRRVLHRQRVVRLFPEIALRLVARDAGLHTDIRVGVGCGCRVAARDGAPTK